MHKVQLLANNSKLQTQMVIRKFQINVLSEYENDQITNIRLGRKALILTNTSAHYTEVKTTQNAVF